MNILVQKYGGTSVGSPERIQNIANRIKTLKSEHDHIVLVVSAMGKTTDELIGLCNDITDEPTPREYDALVSCGENISAALMSMALNHIGVPAVSLTGQQAGVVTKGPYSRSKIVDVNITRIMDELKNGKVVVVTGFQGINESKDVTTIGRGGSDTSAVVLAAALGVKQCDICTDVDGVYTTDPRKVKNASKLSEISYDEMLDLASLGAKVLHPRAVECAKENGIILHVCSSLEPKNGTLVKEASEMEVNRSVTGVTLNSNEAQVSIIGVPDKPGVAAIVFEKLGQAAINIDMIIQSMEENNANSISFTVAKEDLNAAKDVTETVAREMNASSVKTNSNIAKISVVGVGMMSKPGVAAELFKTLGDAGVNIHMISTSEIKISCLIDEEDGDRALQLLHDAFELEKA